MVACCENFLRTLASVAARFFFAWCVNGGDNEQCGNSKQRALKNKFDPRISGVKTRPRVVGVNCVEVDRSSDAPLAFASFATCFTLNVWGWGKGESSDARE